MIADVAESRGLTLRHELLDCCCDQSHSGTPPHGVTLIKCGGWLPQTAGTAVCSRASLTYCFCLW